MSNNNDNKIIINNTNNSKIIQIQYFLLAEEINDEDT
jgi:hypothetical protein